jgi:hypothetical protein
MKVPSIQPADDARTAFTALEEETQPVRELIRMLRVLFTTTADGAGSCDNTLDLNRIAEGLIVIADRLEEGIDRIIDRGVALMKTVEQPTPTDDGEPTRALRSVKTGGGQ